MRYNERMKQIIERGLTLFSRPWPFVGLMSGLALIARSIYLTKADVWHDEAFSAMIIQEPIGDIIARTINDVHPPFYYIVLHLWEGLFGSSVIALRGFSVVCGIATIILLYYLLRKIASENVARLATFFAAIGPFLVRYSDEMRMYSLAALLAVAATYLLVLALSSSNRRRYIWWSLYGLVVAAGIYTQYFFILLIPVHIVYALYTHKWSIVKLISNRGWWLGNLIGAGLFLPWLPSMIGQLSRVQQGFWIPPTALDTIPNTISHFVTYDNALTPIFGYTLLVGLVLSPLLLPKKHRPNAWLLVGWLVVPIVAVTLLSLNRPVYLDRYFTYSSPAFYALLALAIISLKPIIKWQRELLVIAVSLSFIIGIMTVGAVATHKMGHGAAVVNQEYQQGDAIVSAELYTYFDFSYYNRTGTTARLLSDEPFGKYGEYSLLSDKPTIRIAKLSDISAPRVWVIGKTGDHDYFTTMIPHPWQLVTQFEGGDTAIRLYKNTTQ